MSTNEIKQDEIIRMAREVGIEFDEFPHYSISEISKEQLNEFATLVAAHEREKCALVCITLGEYYAECDDFEAEDVAHACAGSIRESEK